MNRVAGLEPSRPTRNEWGESRREGRSTVLNSSLPALSSVLRQEERETRAIALPVHGRKARSKFGELSPRSGAGRSPRAAFLNPVALATSPRRRAHLSIWMTQTASSQPEGLTDGSRRWRRHLRWTGENAARPWKGRRANRPAVLRRNECSSTLVTSGTPSGCGIPTLPSGGLRSA